MVIRSLFAAIHRGITSRRVACVLVFCVLFACSPRVGVWNATEPPVFADETGGTGAATWNRFRGPNGNGRADGIELPTTWQASDYAWRQKLGGVGHSSPVVQGDRVFVTTGDEATGRRTLQCRSLADGSLVWQRSFDTEKHRKHKHNSFATLTPAVDDKYVYFGWATPEQFQIVALDHQGHEKWRVDLGPHKSGHGEGTSPIVYGDLVLIVHEHSGPSTLWALDRHSGRQRWKVQRESGQHWATPCLRRVGERVELITTNWRQGVTAFDVRDGHLIWQADVFDKKHVEASIGSPIVAGELVIGVCGYLGYGNEVVAVRPPKSSNSLDKEGASDRKPGADLVWRTDRGAPLSVTPVATDELVFLWSDGGVVTCCELATGKVHWRKRVGGNFYSSPILAAGRIYNVSMDGRVSVIAASREYQLLGRVELDEGTHSTMAVAGDTLLIRTFSQLLAIRGR